MLATYVTRAVKAGLVAGLVTALFVALVANPLIGFADALGHGDVAVDDSGHEGERADGGHDHGGDQVGDGHSHDGDHAGASHGAAEGAEHGSAVSAAVTNVVSVLSGVLWGILLGGVVFGIVFYLLEPAIPGTGSTKSYLVGFAGFVTVSGAPWLALPPQPPGVEQALATDARLLIYGGMMVAGAVVCLLAALVYDRLRERHSRPVASVAGVAPFGLLAIPLLVAPANTVTGSIPGELGAGLVGMIVFGQLLLWCVLAATHDRLHDVADGDREEDFQTVDASRSVTAD